MDIAVVIPAFNEEEFIAACLDSLKKQSVKLYPIILVNDASTDKTAEIAEQYTDKTFNLSNDKSNRLTSVSLAEVYNAGFDYLIAGNFNFDYVLVIDADTVLPNHYAEELADFMKNNDLDLSSGVIEGEESVKNVRGSGRMISKRLFDLMEHRYPVNYGFDSYPAHKSTLHGLKYKINQNLLFKVLRPSSTNWTKNTFQIYGKGFRAYGYLFIFALSSFLRTSIKLKSLKPIIYGLQGYLTVKRIEWYPKELRKAVKRNQKQILRSKFQL